MVFFLSRPKNWSKYLFLWLAALANPTVTKMKKLPFLSEQTSIRFRLIPHEPPRNYILKLLHSA
jgi:hypothetical protein